MRKQRGHRGGRLHIFLRIMRVIEGESRYGIKTSNKRKYGLTFGRKYKGGHCTESPTSPDSSSQGQEGGLVGLIISPLVLHMKWILLDMFLKFKFVSCACVPFPSTREHSRWTFFGHAKCLSLGFISPFSGISLYRVHSLIVLHRVCSPEVEAFFFHSAISGAIRVSMSRVSAAGAQKTAFGGMPYHSSQTTFLYESETTAE